MNIKIFFNFLRYNIFYFIIAFIVSLLFALVLSSVISSENLADAQIAAYAENTYGEYHVDISGLSSSQKEILEEYSGIEFCLYYRHTDDSTDCIYSDENVLSQAGYKMLYGTFPENENEVLVDKNYLFSQGVSDCESYIGKTVEVLDNEYVITGVFYAGSVSVYSGGSTYTFIFDGDFCPSDLDSAYVSFCSSRNLDTEINTLVEALNLGDDSPYSSNLYLLLSLGYLGADTSESAVNSVTLVLVMSLLALLSGIILNNVLNLLMNRNLKAFGVYKVLNHAAASLMIPLILCFDIAMILGVVAGFCVTNAFLSYIVSLYAEIYMGISLEFPFFECGIVSLVVVLLCLVMQVAKYYKISDMMPIDLLKNSKLTTTKTPKSKQNFFFTSKNSKIDSLKFLCSSVRGNAAKDVIVTLGVVLTVIAGVTIVNLLLNQMSTITYAVDYDFQLSGDFYDYNNEDTNALNTSTISILAESDICDVYAYYEEYSTINIDKSLLSSDYYNLLSQSDTYGNKIKEKFSSKINLPVVVIGYTDEQFDMLGNICPQENECLLYTNSLFYRYNIDTVFGSDDVSFGLKYDIDTDAGIESRSVNLDVAGETNQLLFPNEYIDYAFVILINIDLFSSIFADYESYVTYIVCNDCISDSVERVRETLAGSLSLDIIDYESEKIENAKNELLQKYIFGFMVAICILFSVINVYSLFTLKFESRKNTYIYYIILGVRKAKIFLMYAIEALICFVFGLVMAYLGLLVTNFAVQRVLDSLYVEYNVIFPWGMFFAFECGLAVVILAVLAKVLFSICTLKTDAHSVCAE